MKKKKFYFGIVILIILILIEFFIAIINKCSGESCLGPAIVFYYILVSIIVISCLLFVEYLFDIKEFPYSKNKIIIIFGIISFVIIPACFVYLEYQAQKYAFSANYILIDDNLFSFNDYNSIDDCKIKSRTIINKFACYGFFASKENDISICKKSLEGLAELRYSNDFFASCITSYAVNKGDVSYCNNIQNQEGATGNNLFYECQYECFVTKRENTKCNYINDDKFKNMCLTNTNYVLTNPVIKKYAKIRGLVK